jgi:hypothetical protein
MLVLPFPPNIRASDIVNRRKPSGIRSKGPNAFFIYRKACLDQLIHQNRNLSMIDVSRLVSVSWKNESEIVKDEFRKIAREVDVELRKSCYLCHKRKVPIDYDTHIKREKFKFDLSSDIIKTILKSSGDKVIDDFINHTQTSRKRGGEMEFVPYDQFKNIQFIAEGGFSKIYKALWVDGPIKNWREIKRDWSKITRTHNYTVALKKLNNSKSITSKELNEVQYITYNILNFQ